MPTCNWCGKEAQVNKFGYCMSCNDTIRASIAEIKNKLDELEHKAKVSLSVEEKQEIVAKVTEYGNQLKNYKERSVPFFKSSVSDPCNRIFVQLGVEDRYPSDVPEPYKFAPAVPYKQGKSHVPMIIALAIGWLLALSAISARMETDKQNQSLLAQIAEQTSLAQTQATYIAQQTEYITQLESEIKRLQPPESTSQASAPRSYTLQNGNFVSGKNFTPGVYTITAVSGGGNVYSDNMFDGGINALMGTDTQDGFYQKQYKNINLPEGTILTVDRVKIRLTLVE